MNRKAENFLVDFYAVMVFVLFVVLFAVLFAWSGGKDNATGKVFEANDAPFILSAYLNTPVQYERAMIPLKDLIVRWSSMAEVNEKRELYQLISQKTAVFFSQSYHNRASLLVDESIPIPTGSTATEPDCKATELRRERSVAKQSLPDFQGNIHTILLTLCNPG